MKKLTVTYSVKYTTEIEVEEDLAGEEEHSNIQHVYSDEINDISIPEDQDNLYKPNSFRVHDVEEVPSIPIGGGFPNYGS